MRAFLADPRLQTVTEIDFDGTQSQLCELLGQPVENIHSIRIEPSDDCVFFAKHGDAESGPCWAFGDFDGTPSWDIVLNGRLMLFGYREDREPRPASMSLEQVRRYVAFMRDDLVEIPMDRSIMLVGEDASDEVRAEARRHNARAEAREMKDDAEGCGRKMPTWGWSH
jgi:hypothetical protein